MKPIGLKSIQQKLEDGREVFRLIRKSVRLALDYAIQEPHILKRWVPFGKHAKKPALKKSKPAKSSRRENKQQ